MKTNTQDDYEVSHVKIICNDGTSLIINGVKELEFVTHKKRTSALSGWENDTYGKLIWNRENVPSSILHDPPLKATNNGGTLQPTGETMKIRTNEDKDFAKRMMDAIKDNDYYCPCKIEKTDETHCMCEEFRTQIKNGIEGYCHCGLYYAEKE